MHKSIVSAAIITAFAAGFAFTTVTQSVRDTGPGIEAASDARVSSPAAVVPAITANNDTGLDAGGRPGTIEESISPVAGSSKTGPPATAAPSAEFDWLAELYPDLVRIARLEGQDRNSALQGLFPLLSSADPAVRLAALESVADLNHDAGPQALLAALDDPAPQIRIAALEGLLLQRDESAAGVIGSAVFDQDSDVRITAIDTLAALGNPDSVNLLAALLSDPDRRVRIAALAALGEIGGEVALMYLRQMRYDPDESIRISANAILTEEGDGAAF